ncbi:hypothetical protein BOTBODRAFT_425628 [Botryobasidium botryosum FD-172 SS1]|uniref:DNA2/NAM7 helicase-like C-terminal domain-containing protein n=1 Tax=Botryobasidium botryosum (strain FD-172 SS1) TaxID=930990 RepID=A0A067MJU4_BOTB1|nr:hypothetical protein BOTBODRAFT_425628 [Botryobasidium botryosum FD-172 SS1]
MWPRRFQSLSMHLSIATSNVTVVGASIEARANCAKPQGCSNCVKTSGCAFSKIAFTCGPKSSVAKDQVTSNTGCPQMNQMQSVFPAVNGQSKAGIITAPVAAEFNRIANHIFKGETTSKTSGRHTSDAWLKANPTSKRDAENKKSHISSFPNGKISKTVWESADYSDLDIKNMCAVAIALGNKAGKTEGAFVVQSPYNAPVCVNHFRKNTGSCYPVGVKSPKAKLGEPCDVPGEDNDD